MALSGGIVAALAGLAGGAVLVAIARKRAAAQTGASGSSSTACDALPEEYRQYCKAGLGFIGAAGKALDIIEGLNSSVDEMQDEVARRDAKNRELNGAVAIPASHAGLKGSALRYANGCVPYAGAPGWEKCKPGTQSMLGKDVWGTYDKARPPFPTEAARVAYMKEHEISRDFKDPRALLTGSVDPNYVDPSTWGGNAADGKWYGYVRGERVVCPEGQAPAMWNADGTPARDQRSGAPPCAPNGVLVFPPSTTIPVTVIPQPPPSGSGGTTSRGPRGGVSVT